MQKIWNYIIKHKVMAIIVSVALVIVLVWVVLGARRRANAATTYQTATVERGTLTATIGATGTVRANRTVTLAWQTSGMVEAVNVTPGQAVDAGEVLATLSQASLAQNVILAQADLVTAQRNLDNLTNSKAAMYQAQLALYQAQDALDKAQARYDALKDTYGEDSTERVFLEAKTNLALAQAKVDDSQREYDRLKNGPDPKDIAAAQARLDATQATLNMVRLVAPFAGTVTKVNPMPGDQVSPGTIGFRIDDLSHLLVDVQVSEVDINTVKVGQPVTITFDAIMGKEYHGKVTQVAQAGDVVQGAVNFTVTVELTDADAQIKPGMTAAVIITVNQLKDVLLVPNRAVRVVDGQRVVYVLRNGQTQQIQITLGASSDTVSEVVSGDLKAGDLIILNPPANFSPHGGGGLFGGGG